MTPAVIEPEASRATRRDGLGGRGEDREVAGPLTLALTLARAASATAVLLRGGREAGVARVRDR